MLAPGIVEIQPFDAPLLAGRSGAASGPAWTMPSREEIAAWPLPAMGAIDRALTRFLMRLAGRQVACVRGLEHLRQARGGFIAAISHSTRNEALIVPTILTMHRGGRLVRFLADWNFRIVPGVGFVYRRGETITVVRKPARPAFLNVLKPLYIPRIPPLEQARAHLLAGRPVGLFPEGTVNRHPRRLLRGRNGAARLSIETGCPVLPIGVRYPASGASRPIDDRDIMEVHIGPLLRPPLLAGRSAMPAEVSAWHAAIMGEIGRLSGKSWGPAQKGTSDGEG